MSINFLFHSYRFEQVEKGDMKQSVIQRPVIDYSDLDGPLHVPQASVRYIFRSTLSVLPTLLKPVQTCSVPVTKSHSKTKWSC